MSCLFIAGELLQLCEISESYWIVWTVSSWWL